MLHGIAIIMKCHNCMNGFEAWTGWPEESMVVCDNLQAFDVQICVRTTLVCGSLHVPIEISMFHGLRMSTCGSCTSVTARSDA